NLVIRDVEFLGNHAIADGTLSHAMKANREQSLLSVLKGGGSYKEDAFATDAQSVEDYYRDHGYVKARLGSPELRPLDESPDGRTRWVQLRIPVVEGVRNRSATWSEMGSMWLRSEEIEP